MLRSLKRRSLNETEPLAKIGIDFVVDDDLVYHIGENKRLCIPASCEKTIFELAHDQNNHAGYHRAYQHLVSTVYVPRLSRKIRQYVKHCSSCELNQTKRHATYEELVPIAASTIPFRTIVMDFIVALPGKFDSILIVICKTSKRVSLIAGKSTWDASTWANALLDRLLLAD